MKINRRELLVGSSITAGAFFSLSTMRGLAQAAIDPSKPTSKNFLSKENFLTLTQISEIIMPRTDTPGAIDAGVAEKMDEIFLKTLNIQEQKKVVDGFVAINQTAVAQFEKSFLVLPASQQSQLIHSLNKRMVRANRAEAEQHNPHLSQGDLQHLQNAVEFFGMIKYFTLLIFFRSQPGATQVLQYVPIPGRYNARAPLKEIGKTWATN